MVITVPRDLSVAGGYPCDRGDPRSRPPRLFKKRQSLFKIRTLLVSSRWGRHGVLEGASSAAAERDGTSLKGFKHFCLENGSSQGQDLALTALCVPNWLYSAIYACKGVCSGLLGASWRRPLSSRYGTYKTVETRLWPWLSCIRP
jgi:hypothetical protein